MLFWLVVVVLGVAVIVLAAMKMDESLRWSMFAGLFVVAVGICVVQTVRRVREERAEQRIRDEQFREVILIEARESQRARAAAVQPGPGQTGARRSNAASRSSPDPISPAAAYDPAYPVSAFEVSPTLISLFDVSSPPCDTSNSDSASGYDSSSSSDSSCSTDTSSSSGGGDW